MARSPRPRPFLPFFLRSYHPRRPPTPRDLLCHPSQRCVVSIGLPAGWRSKLEALLSSLMIMTSHRHVLPRTCIPLISPSTPLRLNRLEGYDPSRRPPLQCICDPSGHIHVGILIGQEEGVLEQLSIRRAAIGVFDEAGSELRSLHSTKTSTRS